MRAGSLRHRVAIQAKTEARSAHGEMTDSWATATTVWAAVNPAASSEKDEMDHSVARRTHEIMMRPNTHINADCRFLFDSRYLYPVGPPRDFQERGIFIAVDCAETML